MINEAVLFEKRNNIGIITLNRPQNGNMITAEMVTAFTEIQSRIGYGSGIDILMITGAGEQWFCKGTDPAEYTGYENREVFLTNLQLAAIIGEFNQPTIAVINGKAFDQGLELTLACDIRIAVESACFAISHVLNGMIPWDGGTQRLSRLVGRGKALEMIFLGDTLDAAEALKTGLINYLVPENELKTFAHKLAEEMGKKGPIALRYAKEAILKGMDMTLEQGLRLEADLYFLLHTTEDRREGILAFREKRTPHFRGK